MSLVDVFRVQAPNGEGPYTAHSFNFEFEHDLRGQHPVLYPEKVAFYEKKLENQILYGFPTRGLARDWFGPFGQKGLDWLVEREYRMAHYLVPKQYRHVAKRQCVFLKTEAIYVGSSGIECLFW